MSGALQAVVTILPVLSLLVAFGYGMEFGGPRAPKIVGLRQALSALLLVFYLICFGLLWNQLGHFPVFDLGSVVGFIAFTTFLIYLCAEWRSKTPTTGVFVAAGCFVLQLLASCFWDHSPVPSEAARSSFFAVHVSTALAATSALFLSGFYGGLYLLLLRQIRGKRFGLLFEKLPDLESLSRLNRWAAISGFVLLTIGLNLGIWWAHSGGVTHMNYLDPKVLPVLILWLVFGVIGASQWFPIVSGRRAAWVAVVASLALVISVVVSFLPRGFIHAYGG